MLRFNYYRLPIQNFFARMISIGKMSDGGCELNDCLQITWWVASSTPYTEYENELHISQDAIYFSNRRVNFQLNLTALKNMIEIPVREDK